MVQYEIKNINGPYETFRQRLKEINEKRLPFDDKQWMNFAKTVLEDPNVSTMKRITDTVNFFLTSLLDF